MSRKTQLITTKKTIAKAIPYEPIKRLLPSIGLFVCAAIIYVIALMAVLFPSASQAESTTLEIPAVKETPKPAANLDINLRYSVMYNGSAVGHIETHILSKDNSFNIFSTTKAEGIASILMGGDLVQKCHFDTKKNTIFPNSFTTEKQGKKSYTNTVAYDWKSNKISFNNGEQALDMPKGYIVDNCNFHFAVAFSDAEKFKKDSIYVIDGKKKRIRGYRFLSSSRERLKTPLGDFETTKIVLHRELDENKKLTFWLTDDQPYYPIKFMDSRKGSDRVMLIQNIKNS